MVNGDLSEDWPRQEDLNLTNWTSPPLVYGNMSHLILHVLQINLNLY